MTHPSHGEAWHHFDRTYPAFASNPYNIKLGLCPMVLLITINLIKYILVGLWLLLLIIFRLKYK